MAAGAASADTEEVRALVCAVGEHACDCGTVMLGKSKLLIAGSHDCVLAVGTFHPHTGTVLTPAAVGAFRLAMTAKLAADYLHVVACGNSEVHVQCPLGQRQIKYFATLLLDEGLPLKRTLHAV